MEILIEFFSGMSGTVKIFVGIGGVITFCLGVTSTIYKIRKTRLDIKKENVQQPAEAITPIKKKGYGEKPSGYDLCGGSAKEVYRLRYQADRIEEFDKSVLDEIYNELKIEKINVLDLGCADGYLTKNRFSNSKKWGKVFGLDKQSWAISIAKNDSDERFKFFTFDLIEHAKLNTPITNWVDGTSINLIFSALTIHHLGTNNQQTVLRYLWEQLAAPGALVIRTFDDGLKVTCVEHSDMIEELLGMSEKVPGADDRCHGRRIASQFLSANNDAYKYGMKYFLADTIGMPREEREKFFQYAYGFRIETIKQALDEDPNNIQLQEYHRRALEILETIKEPFINDPLFYTASSECIFYAIKK